MSLCPFQNVFNAIISRTTSILWELYFHRPCLNSWRHKMLYDRQLRMTQCVNNWWYLSPIYSQTIVILWHWAALILQYEQVYQREQLWTIVLLLTMMRWCVFNFSNDVLKCKVRCQTSYFVRKLNCRLQSEHY